MEDSDNNINHSGKLFELLTENEKLAADLLVTNRELVIENEKFASDLVLSNKNLVTENNILAEELIKMENEILKLENDKKNRADELVIANKELIFQQSEKGKQTKALITANKEIISQQDIQEQKTAELVLVNRELALESERGKRATELLIANRKLASQNEEMQRRASELVIANKDRIELLAQLLQSQKLESLGTLAGGVAHDINNVLGAILGLATAHLEIQPADCSAYKAFETIAKAAIRGGKMAKCLLNFARQSPAEEHELDINTILREEVRLLERTTLSRVHLDMEFTSDLRPMRGDASALTHAFMNLCVNAVDAMEENGTLTLRTQNVDNDWIEVVVEDTGCGMSQDVLDRALDPFFTTKEEGKGTGLGLSMVHSTVKAHRGMMEIQSRPGQGTCVRIRFPSCEPLLQVLEPEGGRAPLPPRMPLNLLLVDDDELIQSSTQAILGVLGHGVTGVCSGEEALEKLASGFQPDVVILDINMPGLGGSRTLTRLRSLYPALPVLVSTGKVDQEALNLVAAHSHVSLLPKPFSMGELQAHLEPFGQR